MSIYAVAERVGYESEAAFNCAFKRHVGRPPAAGAVAAGRGVARMRVWDPVAMGGQR